MQYAKLLGIVRGETVPGECAKPLSFLKRCRLVDGYDTPVEQYHDPVDQYGADIASMSVIDERPYGIDNGHDPR
ncbi:hypothetical protein ISF85_31215 [Burkholderia pseudomallei]|nr:hypothetical protein [Burkholderia pseudomallei]